jgi:transposase
MREAGRGRVRVMVMDEARIGQQGTLTRVWAPTGSRPTAVKQTKYEWVYLYAAVEPATGFSSALLAPEVNTGTMSAFLGVLSREVDPGDFVVLIMDQAGWHTSRRLRVPDNIVILLLPPKSPELNPVENLWHFMRSHYLSNRAYDDYNHIKNAAATAYRSLTPDTLRSVCRCDYLERAD